MSLETVISFLLNNFTHIVVNNFILITLSLSFVVSLITFNKGDCGTPGRQQFGLGVCGTFIVFAINVKLAGVAPFFFLVLEKRLVNQQASNHIP